MDEIEDLLARVRFTEDVQGALLRRTSSPYLAWLELAEAYEEGQWDVVAGLTEETGAPSRKIPELYMRALQWASDTMDVVTQKAA